SAAVNDLFNQPNLDIVADVATVAPVFDANLVQSGPITRKGYTSMVTAGPKTGFGLLPSDEGIMFYNSQAMTSVTPIWDFQNQNALGQFQQRIPAEAAEETQERISVELAERNADLRSKYLIGNNTAAIRDFLITHLSLRSRPEAVFVSGLFQWRGAPDQRGADA